jgi:hypothetical protein
MAPRYELHIYNTAGIKQSIATDALSIKSQSAVCAVGIMTMQFSSLSNNAQYMVTNNTIEYYREDLQQGIALYLEFAGLIQIVETTYQDDTILTVVVADYNILLANRIVAYKAGLSNLSTFNNLPAETVMKLIFDYNLGANATVANGRYSNGTITGAVTTASSGAGNLISISCSNQNVLLVMQKIQQTAGGDFEVVYTAPSVYTFTWFTGQLGTDRTATVIFSVENGTIGKLVAATNILNQINLIHVGGQGEGSARAIVSRPAVLPTDISAKEYFIDARNETSTTAYTVAGDTALEDARRNAFSVQAKVLQSNGLRYGRDYFLGDKVGILVNNFVYTCKINSVTISFGADGQEVVDVGLIIF